MIDSILEYYGREKYESIKKSKVLLVSSPESCYSEIFNIFVQSGINSVQILNCSEAEDVSISSDEIGGDNSIGIIRALMMNFTICTEDELKIKSYFRRYDIVISTVDGTLRKRVSRICSSLEMPLIELETATILGNIIAPLLTQHEDIQAIYSEQGINTCFSSINPANMILLMLFNYFSFIYSSKQYQQLVTNEKKQQLFLNNVMKAFTGERNENTSSTSSSSQIIQNMQELLLDIIKRKLEFLETKTSIDLSPSRKVYSILSSPMITNELILKHLYLTWEKILLSQPTLTPTLTPSPSQSQSQTQEIPSLREIYDMILMSCNLPSKVMHYMHGHFLATLEETATTTTATLNRYNRYHGTGGMMMSVSLVSLLSWIRSYIQYYGWCKLLQEIHIRCNNTTISPSSHSSSTSTGTGTSSSSGFMELLYTILNTIYTTTNTTTNNNNNSNISWEGLHEEELTRQFTYQLVYSLSLHIHNITTNTNTNTSTLSAQEGIYLNTLLVDSTNWIELYGGYLPYDYYNDNGYTNSTTTIVKKSIPNMIGHTAKITGLLALPYGHDDMVVISSAYDGTMKVWNPYTSTILYTMDGYHDTNVITTMMVLTKNYIIVGYTTGRIIIYQILLQLLQQQQEPVVIKELSGHTKSIICFSQYTTTTTTLTTDTTTVSDNSDTNMLPIELMNIIVISSSQDNSMKVWNLINGDCIYRMIQKYTIYCLLTLPSSTTYNSDNNDNNDDNDDNVLYVGNEHGLSIYHNHNHNHFQIEEHIDSITSPVYSLCPVSLSSSSSTTTTKCLVIGCMGYIILWNTMTKEIMKQVTFSYHVPIYSIVSIEEVEGNIVVGGEDGYLYQYNLMKESIVAMKKTSGIITSIVLLPNHTTNTNSNSNTDSNKNNKLVLYTIQSDCHIHTWSILQDAHPVVMPPPTSASNRIPLPPSLSLPPPSSTSSSRRSNNANNNTNNNNANDDTDSPATATSSNNHHSKYITFLQPLLSNPSHILSASQDNTLRIWDTITGICIQVFIGHIDTVLCALEFPSTAMLASGGGSYDKSIRLWDQQTGHCVGVLHGHQLRILCLMLFPSCKEYLISGSADRCIMVWNILTKQCIHIFEGHMNHITTLLTTKDYRIISIAKQDPIVHAWKCCFTQQHHHKQQQQQVEQQEEEEYDNHNHRLVAEHHEILFAMYDYDRQDNIMGLFSLFSSNNDDDSDDDERIVIEGNYAIYIQALLPSSTTTAAIATTAVFEEDGNNNKKIAKKMFIKHENARIVSIIEQAASNNKNNKKKIHQIFTINHEYTEISIITVTSCDYEMIVHVIAFNTMYHHILQEIIPHNVYIHNTHRMKQIIPFLRLCHQMKGDEIVGMYLTSSSSTDSCMTLVLVGLKGTIYFTKLIPSQILYDNSFPLLESIYIKNNKKRNNGSFSSGSYHTKDNNKPSDNIINVVKGKESDRKRRYKEVKNTYLLSCGNDELESIENSFIFIFWIIILLIIEVYG